MENKRSAPRGRDPFAVDPLPKAYYYPSPERSLNKAEKATAIKTSYSTDVRQEQNEDNGKINPVDEMFLRGTNMYQTKPGSHDVEDEVNFDETWPSSERPSSWSFTGLEDESPLDLNKYLSHLDRLTELQQNEAVNPSERWRMPGSTAQGTGVTAVRDTAKPSKSKIPVKNGGPGGKKLSDQDTQPRVEEDTDGAVLQRYIDRFRNSQPTSRQEREQRSKSASQDFWWLSNGPPPGAKNERQESSTSHTTPLTTVNLDKYKHLQQLAEKQRASAYIPESPGDKRTIELQERAEKLLERSSSTVLSTEPAVSTEGLGSNTSDMSSLDEYSYRPKFAKYLDSDQRVGYQPLSQPPLLGQEQGGQRMGYKALVPGPLPGQRPPAEDDPLYQWRLRRRMELAQQSAPQDIPQFDFINKTEQQKKVDQKLKEFKQKLTGRSPACSQMQFTPAPQQQQKTHIQTCQDVQQNDGRFHEPQIASPSLHPPKPKTKPVEEIDPHLHLMCDLLPCPHRGQFQGSNEPRSSSEDRKSCKENSETRITEKNEGASKNIDKTCDELGKYKQYLEAEKPDIEIGEQERVTSKVYRGNDEKKEKSIQDIENMVKDIGQKHDEKLESNRLNADIDKNSGGEKYKDSIETGSDKSGSESERSQTKSKHLDREVSNGEHLKETEGKRDKVIKPKHSSSPKNGRKGVNAAIGQVIKEHLFSTSTSTVLSSVESLRASASTDRLPWKQKPPSHDQSHQRQARQPEDADIPCESDEEFSDDNLLQMLRKQRAMYEQQLQEIDSMLNKVEPR